MNNSDGSNDNSRLVAAIDLGSNSFHMIVARLDESGTLSVIDKLRETVRLGGGLKANGKLCKESMQRALDCLEKFGQRIRRPLRRFLIMKTKVTMAIGLKIFISQMNILERWKSLSI